MKKLTLFCLATLLWGCSGGGDFTTRDDDSGGSAGAPSGGSGGDVSTGGTPSGGTGSGGDAGSNGNAGSDAGNGGDAGSGTGGSAGEGTGGDATGGTTTGGSAGSSGNAGDSGTAGVAGSAGNGGSGNDPCTGIYVEVESVTGSTSFPNTSGNQTVVVYNVYGTSQETQLTAVRLVNNVTGNFTSPVDTSALEGVRIRCSDPMGSNIWTLVCSELLTAGAAECATPGCYSAFGGVIQMQIQINPAPEQVGQIRIGIDPGSVNVCGDQSELPAIIITN